MAASLLAAESGPASIPVEFVQTSCNHPEVYHAAPSTPQTSTTNVTIAYTTQQQVSTAVKSNLSDSGLQTVQHLQQHVVAGVAPVQSLGSGNISQQQPVVMETSQSVADEAVAVTPTVVNATDLTQVLSGLQNSGELNTVLQQQPHLVEDLSAIAAGEVSIDPENLRFQYDLMEEAEPVPIKGSKRGKPQVYREQDRFLPIHNVARIMRNAIPRNGKVSKDAKECMQECVSEFISFITSEASDKCIAEKRKTITGDDILVAMATLGFDNYIEPLKLYLQKYREFTKAEKIAGNGSTAGIVGGGQTGQSSLTGGPIVGQVRQQQSGMGRANVVSAPGTGTTQQMTTNSNSSCTYGEDQLQHLLSNPT